MIHTPPRRPSALIARRTLAAGAILAVALLSACAGPAASTSLDATIAFHQRRLREDPSLYPVHAELGEALLERARITHDPRDVQRARDHLLRSIEIQENFPAFKAMAALCNFTHRFEEALVWGDRAFDAYPEDTSVTAQRVESLLGLGRLDDAGALLARTTSAAPDFFLTAARARLLMARGDISAGVAAFDLAADLARAQRASTLEVWAHVSSAAAYLDTGRPTLADPALAAAAAIDPESPLLRIHQAEHMAATGRQAAAMASYESLIIQLRDPVLHAAAFRLAREMGDRGSADRHFRAAEAGMRRALDAGEVYSLESLARLYLDADRDLEQARALAERNLEFKRDADAAALLDQLDARLADRPSAG